MNSSSPKVSIGLPVYNGERYLPLALDSLLAQDFTDFEIILCDNTSQDRSEEICRTYADRDSRIRYYRNEKNIGAAPNYNRVLELARANYFKWMAHDDVCLSGFLRRCVETMDLAPPAVVLVYPFCDLIDGNGKILEQAPDRLETRAKRPFRRLGRVLREVGYAYPLWGLIRTASLRRTRLMGHILADHVLLAELAIQGQFREIAETQFQLRMHEGNAWAICSKEQGNEAWLENARASRQSRRAMMVWHDPSLAGKAMWLPFREEVYLQFLKGVAHASLPPIEKLLCFLTVLAVCYWRRFRNFVSTWKRRVLRRASKSGSVTKENAAGFE